MSGDGGLHAPALERARAAAHPPGEFVGQESFMRGSEIRMLAERAGIARGTRVLDLCCGTGGPGRFITGFTGCSYLGVDASTIAVQIARERSRELPCEFRVARVPPLPQGTFDVVLLLETMLAFADKRPLVDAVARALATGGRFAFTLEAGSPLTAAERASMPAGETVWPVPLETMRDELRRVGLAVRWVRDVTADHRETAAALLHAYERAAIGSEAASGLIAGHRTWVDWLGSGRVRKVMLVAEREMIDSTAPCGLSGRKASSARIEGGPISGISARPRTPRCDGLRPQPPCTR
jgi:SAM-dependent methyltransferase